MTTNTSNSFTQTDKPIAASKALKISLWIAQVLLAFVFCGAGLTKLTTPIAALSQMMPWTGQYSESFVRIIGLIDLAGGLGMLLPSLTRILPGLGIVATAASIVLQVFAVIFHTSRGELMVLPMNFVLLALCAFVLWGRGKRVPILPRN
ncbi:membrane protein [Undibacterium sp. KW1]|uniref:DoxX family protein n=1 Tax=Undibacterium sp. KW1 TaxID=2058624 RepID=UPI001331FB78|nr:DoxX family protein [Undibacterium sp. KW1]BBB61764.1 membrane protein [Undibacterium sp. KW1]